MVPLVLGGGGGGRVIGRSNVRLATGRRQVTWPPAPCVLPRLGKAVPTWEGDAPPPPRPGLLLSRGGEGGRGFWTQNLVYQKWPDQIFPIVNFVFSRDVTLVWGGREGVLGEGSPPPPLGF